VHRERASRYLRICLKGWFGGAKPCQIFPLGRLTGNIAVRRPQQRVSGGMRPSSPHMAGFSNSFYANEHICLILPAQEEPMGSIHQQIADLSPEQRKLLELLLQQEEQHAPAASSGIPRRPNSPTAPLSFAQQRMWLLDQLEPGNPLYTLPTAMRVSGSLDLAALYHSLNALIRRHESLRTTFGLRQAQPIQQISAPSSLPLPLLDLQFLPTHVRTATLRYLLAADADHAFDILHGPLLHTALLRLAPSEHVLLVSMHHIIADGWAIGVFVRELLTLYAARVRGEPARLLELPIQYADFAHWQRERLQGAFLDTQLAYWRQQLAGVPVLQLPTDYPRPARQSYRSAHQPFSLAPGLTRALQALSQSAGVTLFMTLLAGFSALLARWSGQQDFCIGTVVANRTQPELEGVIGFFVNNLALRMNLRGDPPVRTLLEQVRTVTLGAYDHQDTPFEQVLAALQPDRTEQYSPLFQVMCVLQNYPRSQVELPQLRLTPLRTEARRSGFDLTLWMWEEGNQLIGELEYNPKLFEAATIRRIGDQLRTLLAGMAAEPEQRLTRLRLLPEAERREVLEEWNATTVAYPQTQCIHTLFEAQVERTPDAVAVACPSTTSRNRDDHELTYHELNRRANQLARHLRRLGVRPGGRVGICIERSLELIIGVLGILKAGAAYVPLDPAYPKQRLAFMLESAQAQVVLTRQRLVEGLPQHRAHVVCLDTDRELIAQTSPANPAYSVTADNLIYVIYTSGSTGRPKGAGVYHRGFANLLHWFVSEFEIGFHDRVLLITSLSFDLTQKNIFAPLIAGGALYLFASEYYDADMILQIIYDNAITLLNCTPSAFYPLIDQPDQFNQRTPTKLAALRYVFLGGEPIAASRVKDWITAQNGNAHIVNTYGPTECTDIVASYRLDAPERFLETSVPIGKPTFNTKLYILDNDLHLLPVGAVGELCVAGAGVGGGYLNDSDRTAEKFVPNPFDAVPGSRLYRTGDRVRYLADGNIAFLGRIDDQVKLRGFRIELGEIEAMLNQHPSVAECVAVVREDGHGEKRLVAYAVPAEPQNAERRTLHGPEGSSSALSVQRSALGAELRNFLQEKLPNYMLPSAFVLLDALPLTPSGKIDRRALPALDTIRPELDTSFTTPRTPVEDILAKIWADVLGIERVGIYDNFFALGGHSLLVTQVFSRLQEIFRVELPLRNLFEAPTVAGLAQRIETLQQLAPGLQLPPLQPARRDGAMPLSFAQQRLWFLDQFQPDSSLYNLPAAVRIDGALDVGALQRSLSTIIQRHEVLRTTFAMVSQQPVQVIAAAQTARLPVLDLRSLPGSERLIATRRLADEHGQRPFELARGPLFRANLLRLGATEHVLLLNMHHIVSDGWSLGVLINEIATLYPAITAGGPTSIPALPIQYADYAIWQRQWLQGPVLETQLTYWKRHLDGAPALLELPLDRPRSTSVTPHGAHYYFTLPQALSDDLAALSQREEGTLFMTLLAAVQALFVRYSGQVDIVVGSPIAGRTHTELERLIGFFVNTLVLRSNLGGNPTMREVLGRARAVCLDAYAHQDVPFELLVEALQPVRDLSSTPLFQVMFALQNAPLVLELPGLTLHPIASESATARFDLGLSLMESAQGLIGRCEYRTDLFDAATIIRMLGHFQRMLEGVVADPGRRLADLPLLTNAERQQLLVEWNSASPAARDQRSAVSSTVADHACIHQLFAAQAARTPDAIALVFDQPQTAEHSSASVHRPQSIVQLTYCELNRRANQLAQHLRALGVGPEVRVGLCLDRSLELVIGLLGVLKSGGAFVPLDPLHPQERLNFILADAKVRVLITNAIDDVPLTIDDLEEAQTPSVNRQSKIVNVVADWRVIAQAPEHNPDSGVGGENLAYLIYTSGTTGHPKAVLVEHRNLAHTLRASQHQFQFTTQDRMPWIAPVVFDIALFELFSPLLAGGTSIVLTSDQILDLPRLLLVLERCTMLHCVPSLMRQIVREIAANGPDQQRFASLRRLFVGGDSVPPALLAEMRRVLRAAEVHVLYGPTEATIISTRYHTPREQPVDQHVIGTALPNVQSWITDLYGNTVPIGVPGELCLGGAGVTRGYHNRPELAAERFIPNPFSQGSGSRDQGAGRTDHGPPTPDLRLYRTGDLARYRSDGQIEFLGRVDRQVKVRGFRIEIGEVEAILGQHRAVQECVVLAWEALPGDIRLVAYVVPIKEQRATTEDDVTAPALVAELRNFLGARLPEYMVPSAFVLLDGLPLTRNGKVDRRALPTPDTVGPALGNAFVMPRTPVEEALVRIWTELLRVTRVGIHDNFFALGGHSLLATQIIARVRESLQVELPLRSLFEQPTVAGLAGRIEAAWRDATDALPPLEPRPRDQPLPLSFAQQRLWFLDQLHPDGATYTIPAAVRLSGPLDIMALRRSLNMIVQRHEALRTTFAILGEGPVQVIAPALSVPLTLVDLEALPVLRWEIEAARLANELIMRPFDLAHGPLLRATLMRCGAAQHIALLTMHHIVSDGWSVGVFIAELAILYAAFAQGHAALLPALPIQYADYAIWQRTWLQGAVLDAQLAYWRQHLAGLPLVQLPTDQPHPPRASQQGAHVTFVLPQALSDALEALSQGEGVTLFMTGLAAWSTLLARYSAQDDIVVGTPIAGRRHKATEGLIGFFVNMLALRSQLAGNPTFLGLLRRTREVALGAYAHQDVPFEEVVEALQPARDLSRHPLFQVVFALQSEQLSALSLPGLTLTPLPIEYAVVNFDLSLILIESADGLMGMLRYRTDLFEPTTISRMAGHIQALLRGVVAHPEQPIAALPILTEAEIQQIAMWNAGTAPAQPDRCVHQLFEAQAECSPDAVALICAGQHLSYRELNTRVHQLARHLQQLGVIPEMRIGLCMERSLELVIGLLGILKAGGAYIPLDPSYPSERLAFMLADAQPALLLTERQLQTRLPAHTAQTVALDADWPIIAQAGEAVVAGSAMLDHLAYVIYTSGSTGRPKGVLVDHRSLAAVLSTSLGLFQTNDVMPWMASVSFDIALFELLTPLLAGGTVIVLAQHQILDLEGLLATLERCTVFHAVPSLMRQIVQVLRARAQDRPGTVQPRLICVGGDRVPAELLTDLHALFPAAAINVLYGPTEATIIGTRYVVPHDMALQRQLIGVPLPNVQVRLYDQHQQPVPIGVAGEIYLGGAGITRGYLNRPDLTAERFVPNPLARPEDGGRRTTDDADDPPFVRGPSSVVRLYRTGDLARYRADGTLEYLGRRDQQVKVRGFRIELGEIETVLGQHPAVQECVVVAQADGSGDQRLVAYLVPQTGQTPNTTPLRQFLQTRLPEYMVPSAFVLLKVLPRTPNGKLDRARLPMPGQDRPALEQTFVAPRTPLEQLLAALWQDLLGLEAVGVHDSFFELGGNSIRAAVFINKLQALLGEVVHVVAVFDAPTIAELAVSLAEQHPAMLARLFGANQQSNGIDALHTPLVARSPLIALQRHGSRQPFVCVHPAGGEVLCYYDVAQQLGADQPVYGMRAIGLDGEAEPVADIRMMARQYADVLRSEQPAGPYLIGGWSLGGIVAFELAQQLHTQGQHVALLALFDPPPPLLTHTLQKEDDLALLAGFAQHLGLIVDQSAPLIEHIRQLDQDARLRYLLEQAQNANLLPPDVQLPHIRRRLDLFRIHSQALRTYRPERYAGRIVLFQAAERFASEQHNPAHEWSALAAGGVELHTVPGDHYAILRPPNVLVLAERLRATLDKLAAAYPTPIQPHP
jgi:amino acid adenylation domain-containing protein